MSRTTSIDELRANIAMMRDSKKSYEYIGNKYGVNKGIIHMIHKAGYEPRGTTLRRKLGLEDLTIDFVKQVRNSKGRFSKEDLNE